jgi:hypothetical protein
MEIPHDSHTLIESLDRAFPELCPEVGATEQEIFFYAGQRALVKLLTTSYELQMQQIAEDNKEKGDLNV